MHLAALTPVLWTEDLHATIVFYTLNLDFVRTAHTEGWAALERDGIELMISLPTLHGGYNGPVFSGSFYFRCDDVDAWWERLKEKAPVVYPIEDFDYGMREFAIRDNNGYILQFGKSLAAEELAADESGFVSTYSSVVKLAGGIVFEISQLIVPIMGYAQLVQEKVDPGNPVAKEIGEIRRLADGAEECLKRLLEQTQRLQEQRAAIATRRKPGK